MNKVSIVLCKNKTCPLMTVCGRKTTKPNPTMQHYNTFQPYRDGDEGIWKCDFFIDITGF